MRFPWIRGLAIAVPATGGFYAGGNYASGNWGYAPVRSRDWVTSQMNTSVAIQQLRKSPQFQPINRNPKVLEFHSEDGAVSEVSLAFRDKEDPAHTITFVHCGPHTVGFPFMVHGGVLGTLLRQSVQLVLAKDTGNLEIKYKRPTVVDTILKIETMRNANGLKLFITAADTDKVLVEATYTK